MESDTAPQTSEDFSASTQGGVDWQALFHAVRERLWVLILCAVLAGAAAAVYLGNQKQMFQARSVLIIEQEAAPVLDKVNSLHEDRILSIDMINTVVDLIKGYEFAQRVATRLNLQKDPRFLGNLPQKPTGEFTADDAAMYLTHYVTPSYRPRTRLIDIIITQGNSTLTTDLANAYADEYLRYGIDRRADVNKAARQYLLDEEIRLGKSVKSSEEAMQRFREREQRGVLGGKDAANQRGEGGRDHEEPERSRKPHAAAR